MRPFGKAFINSLRVVGFRMGHGSHGVHASNKRGWDGEVKEIGVVQRWMKMRKKELLGDDPVI